MFDQVISVADKDIIKLFTKLINKKFNLMLKRKVTIWKLKDDIYVKIDNKKKLEIHINKQMCVPM